VLFFGDKIIQKSSSTDVCAKINQSRHYSQENQLLKHSIVFVRRLSHPESWLWVPLVTRTRFCGYLSSVIFLVSSVCIFGRHLWPNLQILNSLTRWLALQIWSLLSELLGGLKVVRFINLTKTLIIRAARPPLTIRKKMLVRVTK
jgi:hypothetical protein